MDEEIAISLAQWRLRWPRIRNWGFRLAEFGFVQGLVQLLMAVAGILIVRSLSKHEYAFYAITNSMQTTTNLLADLGIGIGVRSIGGRVWNDRARFGELLNTVLGLRRRFAAISFSVCLPIAGWMLWRNGASIPVLTALCVVIAASVVPLLGVTAWATSAQLHGEYRRIQKLDLGNAILRLALIAAFVMMRINAILAAIAGLVSNWVQMLFLRSWGREKVEVTAPPNIEDRREILRLSIKSLPNTIFFCFQGQVTLLILTLLGSPAGIADITALGRVAALFAVFSITFANVLAPRFARCQDNVRLRRLYLLLVGGTILTILPLAASAWLFPGPFLWLLGGKYASLGQECGWVVMAGCITQIAGVMWTLNASKAWIRVQAPGFIPLILAVQVAAVASLDLRQFHQVLIFNLVTAAAPIPLYVLDALIGLKKTSKN
jgi:O-antigen/teichoic acid export membrane protein